MAKISIKTEGFDLLLDFDPEYECDQEIMAEAFLLLMRRAKAKRFLSGGEG